MEIRFIDMFAGIGGFRLGLAAATESFKTKTKQTRQENPKGLRSRESEGDNERDKRLGSGRTTPRQHPIGSSDRQFTCVWSNDNNKHACQIYRKHFGEVLEADIRTIDVTTISEHDLLCAGFPCQSFSIAGQQRGFQDTRGTLFFEICRVLRVKRPSLLLLENVKGLLSDNNGETFYVILRNLERLGYDCQWQVLNSKDFGVPQNRERVFIVGHLRGKPRPKVFPIGESYQGITEGNGEAAYSDIAPTIDSRTGSYPHWGTYVQMINLHRQRTGEWGKGIHDIKEPSFTLEGGSGRDLVLSPTMTARCDDRGFFQKQLMEQTGLIRRLTPTECERLQGFPDGWTEGISDSQRYKLIGNAVYPELIRLIGKELLKVAQ